MKTKAVPIAWVRRAGIRLDAGPFLGGAIEARMLIEQGKLTTEPLRELTKGHNGGIFNGPKFSRNYVGAEYGVPFVGSSDMLMADLTNLPYLRRKDAESAKLGFLRLQPDMTLISCSGTIGRTVYVRQDMAHMWSSQHIMKVVPNPDAIRSGFLYAFLSSRFGVAMITSGTYGAIIQHIEAEHIADLPVPRLGETLERKAHELVEKAAKLRVLASTNRAMAIKAAVELTGWTGATGKRLVAKVKSSQLVRRMDAFHHSAGVSESRRILASHPESEVIGKRVASVFEPNRGARRKVDDPDYGVPFLSSSDVFRLDPQGEYLISRKATPHLETLIVTKEDLLVPRSGQIGGIIGRAVMPLPSYYGQAASEHLVRIRCRSYEDACYLWAILASEPGYWALVGTAFGSSIPSLDAELVFDLSIPWTKDKRRHIIVRLVNEAVTQQAAAILAEREAVASVENAIEEAA